MIGENILRTLIEKQIQHDEKTERQAGSSGHLGHVDYVIDSVNVSDIENGLTEIIYQYRLITETEFTYYPDNPPYEVKYEKLIRINNDGEILYQEEKKCLGSNLDFEIPQHDE